MLEIRNTERSTHYMPLPKDLIMGYSFLVQLVFGIPFQFRHEIVEAKLFYAAHYVCMFHIYRLRTMYVA